MEYTDFVGVDVSQATLDVVVRSTRAHVQIANTEAGRIKLVKWLARQGVEWDGALFCFENTGIYSLPLLIFLAEKNAKYVQISGLAAKRSMGIKRGKTDKVDAGALAEYAYRHREELIPNSPPSTVLLKARRFFSLREQFVKHRAGLKARMGVELRMLQLLKNDKGVRMQQKAIDQLTKHIDQLDKDIIELIASEASLNKNYELATSVKGIGPQTAIYMLITTENFTLFKDWRKYACYAGIVPFDHRSGTSISRKSRVSSMANKRIKTLLSSAAASAIQSNVEMKMYYQRRIAEGKHHMATLNIIRNKLVSRVFAAVSRQEPYLDLHKFAA
jgi:transposase